MTGRDYFAGCAEGEPKGSLEALLSDQHCRVCWAPVPGEHSQQPQCERCEADDVSYAAMMAREGRTAVQIVAEATQRKEPTMPEMTREEQEAIDNDLAVVGDCAYCGEPMLVMRFIRSARHVCRACVAEQATQ